MIFLANRTNEITQIKNLNFSLLFGRINLQESIGKNFFKEIMEELRDSIDENLLKTDYQTLSDVPAALSLELKRMIQNDF